MLAVSQDAHQGVAKPTLGPSLMQHVTSLLDNGQSLVSSVQEGYDQLVQAIIRPPRCSYTEAELGAKRFMFAGRVYHREDLEIFSNRPGQRLKLKCSHFKPEPKTEGCRDGRPVRRPCVIFCHGNAASRAEGIDYLKTVLAASADLFIFDFGGSGQSEGEYVSLGHWEKEDLAAVVEHLRSSGVSSIGLWGRSMGAVTSLLYAVRDAGIAGIVADSPFSDLRTLAGELCEKETFGSVPVWLADAALSVVKVSIRQRVEFDLDELCPIDTASSTNIPAIFATAREDDFIYPHHAQRIQEEYLGESRLIMFEGDHNSQRPSDFLDEARKFFIRTLHSEARCSEIWKFDKTLSERQPAEVDPEKKKQEDEARNRAAANRMRHEELLLASPFGDSLGVNGPLPSSIPLPEPEPLQLSEAQKCAEAARRRLEAIKSEKSSAQLEATKHTSAPAPRTSARERRNDATPAANGQANAANQAVAPSSQQLLQGDEIKSQLLGLGFSESQVVAAMKRSSTLEGCVEWILTSS